MKDSLKVMSCSAKRNVWQKLMNETCIAIGGLSDGAMAEPGRVRERGSKGTTGKEEKVATLLLL